MAQFNIKNLTNHLNVMVRDNICAYKKIEVSKSKIWISKMSVILEYSTSVLA